MRPRSAPCNTSCLLRFVGLSAAQVAGLSLAEKPLFACNSHANELFYMNPNNAKWLKPADAAKVACCTSSARRRHRRRSYSSHNSHNSRSCCNPQQQFLRRMMLTVEPASRWRRLESRTTR